MPDDVYIQGEYGGTNMREYVTKQQVIDAIAPMAGVGNRVLDKVRYLPGIPAPEWKSVISDPPEWILLL